MSNWTTKDFTVEEVAYLKSKGWDVDATRLYQTSNGGYHIIIKRPDNLFEIVTWMDDFESNGWWAFDSLWPTLKKALENAL
jgi:hypothetical protein